MLSQSTNDRNRDVAYLRLRERFHEWTEVRDAPVDEIEEAIRPGGISKVKSARIKSILQAITASAPAHELSLDWLAELTVPEAQDYLCGLPGVGRKTAACVLLFALGMRDVPVDTHVSRVGMRLHLLRPGAPFEELHDTMLAITPAGPGAGAAHEPAAPRPADVPRAPAPVRRLRAGADVPQRRDVLATGGHFRGQSSSERGVCRQRHGGWTDPDAPRRRRPIGRKTPRHGRLVAFTSRGSSETRPPGDLTEKAVGASSGKRSDAAQEGV